MTLETLTKIKDSVLAKKFEDFENITLQEGGYVFIDRNAPRFKLVIDFLRDNCKKPNFKT